MTKPLEGMLVVSFDQVVAAPLAARRLADAGARVIKLERKEGDAARGHDRVAQGASTYFAWLNRGKESVVVDMKADADRRLFDALIGKADIFIQNLRPGALAGLGYPIESLLKKYPRADRLLDLGLWRRRPLRRPQGLRPADPGRDRDWRR